MAFFVPIIIGTTDYWAGNGGILTYDDWSWKMRFKIIAENNIQPNGDESIPALGELHQLHSTQTIRFPYSINGAARSYHAQVNYDFGNHGGNTAFQSASGDDSEGMHWDMDSSSHYGNFEHSAFSVSTLTNDLENYASSYANPNAEIEHNGSNIDPWNVGVQGTNAGESQFPLPINPLPDGYLDMFPQTFATAGVNGIVNPYGTPVAHDAKTEYIV